MINCSLILKGMIIGLAKVVPGVSGSLIAVSLGIYSVAIEAISHPFRNLKNNLIFLGNVGVGVLFSIAICSNIVSFFLSKYYFLTVILFVGFILGTFPKLTKEICVTKKSDYIIVFLITSLVFLLSNYRNTVTYIYENTIGNNLYVLLLGFLDATTMVIPGISGTAIFILLGSYSFILDLFASFSDFSIFLHLIPFLFFSIGLGLGIVLVSKIMNYTLKYRKKETYLFILGFAISSILLLCVDLFSMNVLLTEFLLGIILFVIGYKISFRLNV